MSKIIECVPNFSTSDPKILNQILDEIKKIPEIKILDFSSDVDHNRSVVTFTGNEKNILNGAYNAIKKASEIIDLNKHSGVHPFIGATDVVPFVPLRNSSMDECCQIAEKLGKKVGKNLKIPVYLFEYSAKRPERKNLSHIRNQGFLKLENEIKTNEDLNPDFGPKKIGSAGGICIGARKILIAFNINISTCHSYSTHCHSCENRNLNIFRIATNIAKKIRESNGGLPCVKALALKLKNQHKIQISMNLTDYTITSPKTVFDFIKKECSENNLEILESELVGLIPEKALFPNAEKYLMLKTHPKSLFPDRSRGQA